MTTLLSRGDRGRKVANLQSNLNKVGGMLKIDSDFGAATERAVRYAQNIAGISVNGAVNRKMLDWVEAQPDPFPKLDTEGVAFIAREETGGLYYYDQVAKAPHYPGESSGITLGVGFDLRFQKLSVFKKHWKKYLSASEYSELSKDIGRRGTKKRVRELKSLGIEIPFQIAWNIFLSHTLPEYYKKTVAVYPSTPSLPSLCACALVSLVYNRGDGFSGSRRREMREIRELLEQASDSCISDKKKKTILTKVEVEFVRMQRIWPLNTGLRKRRQEEANLWRRGVTML